MTQATRIKFLVAVPWQMRGRSLEGRPASGRSTDDLLQTTLNRQPQEGTMDPPLQHA